MHCWPPVQEWPHVPQLLPSDILFVQAVPQ
jgi:hypothetical protein